jgi:hypothetical protein
MLNAREWLEEHLDKLTSVQRRALAAGDRAARQLLRGVTVETTDVEYLRETVKVIAGSALSEFAQAA